ncbi:hypothetical protein SAMN05192561_10265 [Halopenitus malekzadehii]|uniref:Uncharacterized protein n=1 Tax=Halopenitus malekzadehii TaxID=1267564 RepID=A0A1H6IH85_9EURY|nr:hypothetical protein [Halopenitus malekzadehii]SEH45719.1 hypothetical protein SAMN05192561_10265 [Halopenitus malekzadehii]
MEYRAVPALVITCLVATSLLLGGVTHTASADSEYDITIDGSVDTPTREIALEGATYEVSAIGKAAIGSSVNVNVQAPAPDQEYHVYLYNSDRQIIDQNRGNGSGTATFDLSGLSAGTYVFAVQERGATQVLHPLVIEGYDTSIQAPESASIGENLTVEVTTQQLQSDVAKDSIDVVIANDNQQIRSTSTGTSGTQDISINTENLNTGSYEVYANVRGQNVVFDQKEILGISNGHSVELEAAETSTPSSGDGSSGGGGGGGGSEASATPTATEAVETPESTETTPTDVSSPSHTETDSAPSTDTNSPSNTATDANDESDTTTSSVDTPHDETTEAVTPNEVSTSTPDTNTSIPGFSFITVGVLLVLTTIFLKSSRSR